MKNLTKKFESLAALSAFISNNHPCGYFENYLSEELATGRKRPEFYGTPDYETANKMLLCGWHEGAERVNAAMIKSAAAMSERPRCYNSVVGFAPNVPNYLSGCPLNMINKKRVRVPARVVSIVYNCAVDYTVSTGQIETVAAKLFNVVAGLESSGVRVDLYVIMCAKKGAETFSMSVKIKSAGQPFNLLKMVYPVVHPSFLRRHCISVLDRAGVSKKIKWGNHGMPIDNNWEQKECAAKLGLDTKNIFNYYQLSGKTEKEILAMIK